MRDAGFSEKQATLDLTGSNSVSLGHVFTNFACFEVGIEVVTPATTTAVVVKFYAQDTPLTSAPSSGEFAVVTAPTAALAAGAIVRKKVNVNLKKGQKIWAKVTTTTTGASDAIVFLKAYPAGEGDADASVSVVDSTT